MSGELCDLQIEKAVISSFMLEDRTEESLSWLANLKPEMFCSGFYRRIFETIVKLSNSGSSFDVFSIQATGFPSDIGIQAQLLEVMQEAVSVAQTPSWIAILRDRWSRREIIKNCASAEAVAHDLDTPVTDICGRLEASISGVGVSSIDNASRTTIDVIETALSEMQDAHERIKAGGDAVDRVRYCVPWVDETFAAFRGDLVTLVAYQGTGKTAFALQTFIAQAMSGLKVGYFCSETKAQALIKKIMASLAGLSVRDAFEPGENAKLGRLLRQVETLKNIRSNFAIWGISDLRHDMSKLCYLARRTKAQLGGLDAIYVDHLQDFHAPIEYINRRPDEGIAANVQTLKLLGDNLNCVVNMLAQMDKKSMDEKRPSKKSLRGTSVILDVSSVIHFLFNPRKIGAPPMVREEIEWYSDKNRDDSNWFRKIMFDGPARTFAPQARFSRADDPEPFEDNRAGRERDL